MARRAVALGAPALLLGFLATGATPLARAGPVGVLFPSLPPCDLPRSFLVNISAAGTANTPAGLGYMEDSSARGTDNNAQDRAAAGLTYLGQLLSHDLADLDGGSVEVRRTPPRGGIYRGPGAPKNLATFALDLDTLYGRRGHPRATGDRAKLAMGTPTNALDWPRDAAGAARIADPRNDEHFIIAQLAGLFARAHNAFVDEVSNRCGGGARLRRFRIAQRLVRLHFQSIILTDWLPLFVTREVLDDVAARGRRLFTGRLPAAGAVPVEFLAGTNRLGHSIARGRYRLNGLTPGPVRLFPLSPTEAQPENNLLGGRPIPVASNIEWNRFFNFSDSRVGDIRNDTDQFAGLQVYRRIDRLYARPLMRLPVEGPGLPDVPLANSSGSVAGRRVVSLASLDLLRGASLGLPCGGAAAAAAATMVGGPPPLGINDFGLTLPPAAGGAGLDPADVPSDVPFLLYVLTEAGVRAEGERLGPIGGRIQAEVILGALERDRRSLARKPGWVSPLTGAGGVRMVDLINFVEGDLPLADPAALCRS
ncbi:hypothetical protein MMPV_007642 [Pyropia vietnamensis]